MSSITTGVSSTQGSEPLMQPQHNLLGETSSTEMPSSANNLNKHLTTTATSSNISNSSSRSSFLELAHHDSLVWSRRESVDRMRHRTEFEDLKLLGKGAFGTTRQVQNKVDSKIYALKRVSLGLLNDDLTAAEKVLREVQVLSSLNSKHIVRYYSAWIEQGNFEQQDDDDDDEYGDTTTRNSRCSDWTASDNNDASIQQQSDNFPICNLCLMCYKDWEVSFEHWGLLDSVLQPLNLCQGCYLKSLPPNMDPTTVSIREKEVLPLYLFILMEYCELTLQEAVEEIHSTTTTTTTTMVIKKMRVYGRTLLNVFRDWSIVIPDISSIETLNQIISLFMKVLSNLEI